MTMCETRSSILTFITALPEPSRRSTAAKAEASLLPLEVVVLADCLIELWDYRRIDASLQAWTAAVAGTPYAHRIAQVGRRAALRMGPSHGCRPRH